MSFQNKINKQRKGVWRYAEFYDEFIKPGNRLKLDDGNTPAPEGDIGQCRLQELEYFHHLILTYFLVL